MTGVDGSGGETVAIPMVNIVNYWWVIAQQVTEMVNSIFARPGNTTEEIDLAIEQDPHLLKNPLIQKRASEKWMEVKKYIHLVSEVFRWRWIGATPQEVEKGIETIITFADEKQLQVIESTWHYNKEWEFVGWFLRDGEMMEKIEEIAQLNLARGSKEVLKAA